MNAAMIAKCILTLIAGVGVFLIACAMLSSNLEAIGGRRLNALLGKASHSKLVGVGIGALTTAIIQSSSATSVMVLGFVNAGVMTLYQAATVLFGANVGTTVTGLFVALGLSGGGAISVSVVLSAFTGIGAFVLAFAKRDGARRLGGIIAGFGLLFVGLGLMSDAMSGIADSSAVREFLATFRSPYALVVIGALLTAIVQSSSVTTSLAIATVAGGLISLNQGIYLTMGANVGTCVTALIAGLAGTVNAKRAALIHLFFNVFGVLLFFTIGLILKLGGTDFGSLLCSVLPHKPQVRLAVFHTVFNFATLLFVLPLTAPLVRLVTKLVSDLTSFEKEVGKKTLS